MLSHASLRPPSAPTAARRYEEERDAVTRLTLSTIRSHGRPPLRAPAPSSSGDTALRRPRRLNRNTSI